MILDCSKVHRIKLCYCSDLLNVRLPLVPKMMDALLASCPPLSKGHRVCDLLAGTGKVTRHLLPVYPNATYTLVDMSEERLSIAGSVVANLALPIQDN